MTYTTISTILLLISFSFAASAGTIGTIETFTGEIIEMKNEPSSRKLNMSKLPVGCDCGNQAFQLFYFGKEGKLEKMAEKLIKKVVINEGAVYCKSFSKSSSLGSGSTRSLATNMKLDQPMELWGLPASARSKKIVLQSILVQNDEYVLSMFNNDSGNGFVSIVEKEDRKMINGGVNYLSVGFGAPGEQFVRDMKKYFADCDELIAIISKNEKINAAAQKRRDKVFVMAGVGNINCEN